MKKPCKVSCLKKEKKISYRKTSLEKPCKRLTKFLHHHWIGTSGTEQGGWLGIATPVISHHEKGEMNILYYFIRLGKIRSISSNFANSKGHTLRPLQHLTVHVLEFVWNLCTDDTESNSYIKQATCTPCTEDVILTVSFKSFNILIILWHHKIKLWED